MSTTNAATTIESASDQPSIVFMTSASANRFTPAISTDANANVIALKRCVGLLKRSRRYSGTLRTFVP